MGKESVYVVTRCNNDYDQNGEYFVAVFLTHPTEKQLTKMLQDDSYIADKDLWTTAKHLDKGGGRIKDEDAWYYMRIAKAGEVYESRN